MSHRVANARGRGGGKWIVLDNSMSTVNHAQPPVEVMKRLDLMITEQ